MRTLLFVQTGDARPKWAGNVNGPLPHWCKHDLSEDAAALVFVPGAGNYKATSAVHLRKARADRWWLVECETAYHGRKVIEAAARGEQTVGRILASGGRP